MVLRASILPEFSRRSPAFVGNCIASCELFLFLVQSSVYRRRSLLYFRQSVQVTWLYRTHQSIMLPTWYCWLRYSLTFRPMPDVPINCCCFEKWRLEKKAEGSIGTWWPGIRFRDSTTPSFIGPVSTTSGVRDRCPCRCCNRSRNRHEGLQKRTSLTSYRDFGWMEEAWAGDQA